MTNNITQSRITSECSYHSNDQSRSWRSLLHLQSVPILLCKHCKQTVSLSIKPPAITQNQTKAVCCLLLLTGNKTL